MIAELLRRKPDRSNHATAQIAKADAHTVASVRAELEGRLEIPNVAERIDTRGRSQPAVKPSRPSPPASLDESAPSHRQAVLHYPTVLHQHLDELVKLLGDERRKIATLPLEKRVALARRCLRALDVKPDDLQAKYGRTETLS